MMRTIILIPLVFLTLIQLGNSQDDLTEAFRKSYYSETYQKYDEAIESIKLVYQSDSYVINLRLGWLHYANGDYIESKRYYEKAIELESNSIEARLGYAYPLNDLLDIESLKANYEAILKIDPLHSLANYRLALIYYNQKNFNKAIKYLETTVSLYPFDYDSLVLMAAINVGLGNIEAAKTNYRLALLYYPEDATIAEELNKL
jgi:tetratricopeptide (TPR) repeat protein